MGRFSTRCPGPAASWSRGCGMSSAEEVCRAVDRQRAQQATIFQDFDLRNSTLGAVRRRGSGCATTAEREHASNLRFDGCFPLASAGGTASGCRENSRQLPVRMRSLFRERSAEEFFPDQVKGCLYHSGHRFSTFIRDDSQDLKIR